MWTQAWRRLNKKGKDEGVVRKRYYNYYNYHNSNYNYY